MSRELLQMAADTIEAMWDRHAGGKLNIGAASSSFIHRAQLTLAALRAALAQPAEPVAWAQNPKAGFWCWCNADEPGAIPLYTPPPIDSHGGNLDSAFDAAQPAVREPLKAWEFVAMWATAAEKHGDTYDTAVALGRAIEAHHGITGDSK